MLRFYNGVLQLQSSVVLGVVVVVIILIGWFQESLHAEKRKREKELEMLRSSEPKLMSEVSNLRQAMSRMREEMEQFKDIDGLKRAFDATQIKLTVSLSHTTVHTYLLI